MLGSDPIMNEDSAPSDAAGPTTTQPEHSFVELSSLLGRGTRYEGKVYFEGRARIEGSFSGEIRGEDVLVIGRRG